MNGFGVEDLVLLTVGFLRDPRFFVGDPAPRRPPGIRVQFPEPQSLHVRANLFWDS